MLRLNTAGDNGKRHVTSAVKPINMLQCYALLLTEADSAKAAGVFGANAPRPLSSKRPERCRDPSFISASTVAALTGLTRLTYLQLHASALAAGALQSAYYLWPQGPAL